MALVTINNLPALVGAVDTANDNLILRDASTSSTVKTTPAAVVAAEATTRAAADTTLQTNITAEATARATADATLTTNLNTEITNRTNADNLRLLLAGGTMTGAIVLPAVDPAADNQATRRLYVDTADNLRARILIDYDPTATGAFPTGATIADGARYRVSVVGTITTTVGPLTVYAVKVGDILEALVNNPSNAAADWTIQSVLMLPSSEAVVGPLEIATNAEMLAASDNTRAITPLRLDEFMTTVVYAEQEVNASPVGVLAAAPRIFFVRTAVAAITFNLPAIADIAAALVQKYRLVICDMDGSAASNNITINRSGIDTINGGTSIRLNTNYCSVMLVPRGTTWVVLYNDSYRDSQNITYVNLGAIQNIANAAEVRIDFNAISSGYNPFSQFVTIAPFTYTPLYSGLYYVSLQAHIDFVASHGLSLRVKQGANVITAHDYITPAITTGANGNRYVLDSIVAMSAGVAYDFYAWQNSGGGLNFNSGATGTRLIIKRISS